MSNQIIKNYHYKIQSTTHIKYYYSIKDVAIDFNCSTRLLLRKIKNNNIDKRKSKIKDIKITRICEPSYKMVKRDLNSNS